MSDGEIIFSPIPDISALQGRFSDYNLNTLLSNNVALEKTPSVNEVDFNAIDDVANIVEKEFQN